MASAMGRYLIRRTLFLILVLFVVSLITFIVFVKLPASDPARRAAGEPDHPREHRGGPARFRAGQAPVRPVRAVRQGPDPWPGLFLNEDVYYSYTNFVPVKDELFARLPVTIALAVGAAICWLLLGIPIGIISAVRRRSIWDRSAMVFALIGVSAPTFWLGFLFLYVFWFKLQWAPASGIPIGESVPEAVLQGRFILPWLVLALTSAAFYARMVRGNLIETMNEDYIRTARAKGLSEKQVIYKHGLRAALTPVVTMFGLDLGLLLGGAFITENVFNLQGLVSMRSRASPATTSPR